MGHSTLNYYNQNFLKVAERYESADVTQLHDFLSSSLKPGGRLLELGCGSGRDAAFMVSQGFKVLATDGSASMIEQAKQHHPELAGHMVHLKLPDGLSNEFAPERKPKNFVKYKADEKFNHKHILNIPRIKISDQRSNWQNLRFSVGHELGVFDGIYAVAVLMHLSVQEIESTISAVNSLLAAKGRFVFSVPVRRDDVITNELDSKGRRFTALSPDGWKNLCLKCNLQIVRTMISEDGLGRGGVVWMNYLAEKL